MRESIFEHNNNFQHDLQITNWLESLQFQGVNGFLKKKMINQFKHFIVGYLLATLSTQFRCSHPIDKNNQLSILHMIDMHRTANIIIVWILKIATKLFFEHIIGHHSFLGKKNLRINWVNKMNSIKAILQNQPTNIWLK